MNELLQSDAFKIYLGCLTMLATQCFVLGSLTAVRRGIYKNPATPEDAIDGKVAETLSPEVDRARRTHSNAAENVPILLIVGLAYVLAGASPVWVGAFMGTVTLARLLHAVFYLRAMQPWRSVAHVVANLAKFGMLGHMLKMGFFP